MASSDFTLREVLTGFSLHLDDQIDLYATIPAEAPGEHLRLTLEENVPLALAVHTEKARSELIVAPLLVELRKRMNRQISLFSGIDFTVDAERGLNGVCDFLVSRSPEQLLVLAPVLAIVEAKNDNIKSGFGQCIAAMAAAQLFNQRAGTGIEVVHGVVTTGSIWKFLQLAGTTVRIDRPEYYLDQVDRIFGILLHLVSPAGSPVPAATPAPPGRPAPSPSSRA